jgi:rubrerythrin
MATLVGTQSNFVDALKELIELDYDAVEAYEAAINRLENKEYKSQLTNFRDDHKRHVKELSALMKKHNEEAPTGPDMSKQWLAKGKVVLANMVGDKTILAAMKTNEDDTNTAYERLCKHKERWDDAMDILNRGLADEKTHRAWIEKQLA